MSELGFRNQLRGEPVCGTSQQGGRAGPQVTLAVSPCPSARELELEDRQSRLQQELRERMAVEGKRRASGWEGKVGHCPRPHA